MSVRCPSGHPSTATDYCDVCGAPIGDGGGSLDLGDAGAGGRGAGVGGAGDPGPASTTVLPTATSQTCPSCGTENAAEALFCEACGYDFTTGALPRPPEPPAGTPAAPPGSPSAPSSAGSAPGAAPSPGAPPPLAPRVPLDWVVEVWVDPDWYAEQDGAEPCPSPGLPAIVPLAVRSVLVGRTSRSRNIHPDVACDADIAVSRRHAQLTTDGTRWWVEDLQSANGTFVGPSSGPLPTRPIVPGQRRELAEDDRVYVGAWTRLVVRRATDEERRAFG